MNRYIVILSLLLFSLLVISGQIINKKNREIVSLQTEINSLNSTIKELKPSKNKEQNTDSNFAYIEKEVQECMKKQNYTTIGMSNCVYDSVPAWEKEINNSLSILKTCLTPQQYKLVKTSQKKWEEYKDIQWETISEIYNSKLGTIYINISAGEKVDIYKQRAQELFSLVDRQ